MPARKSAKKASAKKTAKGKAKRTGPIVVLYGPPIYDAIRRGNRAEMERLAARARKHISEVETALAALEKKLGS